MTDAGMPRTDADPRVSIVIVAARPSAYFHQALDAIRAIESPAWEVIGVLDEPLADAGPQIRFLASGPIGPAQKRDLAAAEARGEILAFLDADAYPSSNWLAAAIERFADASVWAVGGPGVTPPEDDFWQHVSGWAFASSVVAGPARHRYVAESAREVDDYPSMNLLVRRRAFEEVGGFDSEFYPGEDTKLCLEITRRGGRIVYEPRALVYHHRRSLLGGHFAQVAAYGRHRGYFARRFPETSRRLPYFVPSLWVAWLLLGRVAGRWMPWLRAADRLISVVYAAAVFWSGLQVGRASGDARAALAVMPAIVGTHLTYGVAFLRGLVARRP